MHGFVRQQRSRRVSTACQADAGVEDNAKVFKVEPPLTRGWPAKRSPAASPACCTACCMLEEHQLVFCQVDCQCPLLAEMLKPVELLLQACC
jgi:hypothetical protein